MNLELLKKAIFLDRDGTLNELIFNNQTKCFESPHLVSDLKVIPSSVEALKILKTLDFKLFVVSNQPSPAKGKATLIEINNIADKFKSLMVESEIYITDFFYCFHHPQGVVPELTLECKCRKPKSYFLLEAAKKFKLDLINSWMIGDQNTDIECGKNANCKTILIKNEHSSDKRGQSNPNFSAANILEAALIIKQSLQL